jgi:nucleotide-binding universal stress UspA family protein
MIMFQRILVPLDGSARAEHAIPVAVRLARASGGTVVFVSMVHPQFEIGEYGPEDEAMGVPPSTYEKHLAGAEHYLQQMTTLFANDLAGVHVEQEVDTGANAATIFSIARMEHIDLIVLCSHGGHDLFHWVFRSIARDAVHHSPVPILVLKESGGLFLTSGQARPLRMLVPLDGSQLAEAALQPALQLLTALAAPEQGEMHLVQVVDLPSIEGKTLLRAYDIKQEQEHAIQEAEDYLKGIAHRLSEALPADSRLVITSSLMVSNHAARTLTEMIKNLAEDEQEHSYDFLAMATHGRTGFQRLRLGSVTEHLLGATDLPLLIVRPPQPAGQPEREAGMQTKREIEMH